jgi:hypothetical protein
LDGLWADTNKSQHATDLDLNRAYLKLLLFFKVFGFTYKKNPQSKVSQIFLSKERTPNSSQ